MNYDSILVGDYLQVRIENKEGDRNLDGGILTGLVIRKTDSQRQVQLHTGWCCHEKDSVLEHRQPQAHEQVELGWKGVRVLADDIRREANDIASPDPFRQGNPDRILGLAQGLFELAESMANDA